MAAVAVLPAQGLAGVAEAGVVPDDGVAGVAWEAADVVVFAAELGDCGGEDEEGED